MHYILSGFRVYIFTGSNSKKRAKRWLKKIKTNIMDLSMGQFNSIWFSPKAFLGEFGNCVMIIDHLSLSVYCSLPKRFLSMKVISSKIQVVTTETHKVEYNGEEYTLIWYLKENSDRIIDTVLRDKNGHDVYAASILEEIETFIMEQTNKPS